MRQKLRVVRDDQTADDAAMQAHCAAAAGRSAREARQATYKCLLAAVVALVPGFFDWTQYRGLVVLMVPFCLGSALMAAFQWRFSKRRAERLAATVSLAELELAEAAAGYAARLYKRSTVLAEPIVVVPLTVGVTLLLVLLYARVYFAGLGTEVVSLLGVADLPDFIFRFSGATALGGIFVCVLLLGTTPGIAPWWTSPALPLCLLLWACGAGAWIMSASAAAQTERLELPCVRAEVRGQPVAGRCVRSLAVLSHQRVLDVDGEVVVVPDADITVISWLL